MEDTRLTLEQKLNLALQEAKKESGKSDVKLTDLLVDIFPDSEEDTSADSNSEISGGETARLEFLINLELLLSKDNFRVEADEFFRKDLTLEQMVEIMHEAEEKTDDDSFENIDELTEGDVEESEEESTEDEVEEEELAV